MSQSSVPFDRVQEAFVKPMQDMQNIIADMARTTPGPAMMSPLMMHPAAAAAAATALSFGAASYMAGLFFGSVQGAMETSKRFGPTTGAYGKAATETASETARRTADAARAMLDEAAKRAAETARPVDKAVRTAEAVAARTMARTAASMETSAEQPVKPAAPVKKPARSRVSASVAAKKTMNAPKKTQVSPKPAASAAMAKPRGVDKPQTPDDLKQIAGVGPKLEEVLNRLGIWTFGQIAGWGEKEIAWVDDYLQFRGRIARDDWIGQAKGLAKK